MPVGRDEAARAVLEWNPEALLMRYIGLILSLGIICWVLYQAAGGGKAETIIPAEQQKALNTAKGMEDALKEASKKSMEQAEKASGG